MTMEKRLSANRNLFDEYSEFHDLLTDTLSAFEDLYYEMETAIEDISDSLEDARHRLDDIDTAFRRIQCRNRLRQRKRVHFYSPPEPMNFSFRFQKQIVPKSRSHVLSGQGGV